MPNAKYRVPSAAQLIISRHRIEFPCCAWSSRVDNDARVERENASKLELRNNALLLLIETEHAYRKPDGIKRVKRSIDLQKWKRGDMKQAWRRANTRCLFSFGRKTINNRWEHRRFTVRETGRYTRSNGGRRYKRENKILTRVNARRGNSSSFA